MDKRLMRDICRSRTYCNGFLHCCSLRASNANVEASLSSSSFLLRACKKSTKSKVVNCRRSLGYDPGVQHKGPGACHIIGTGRDAIEWSRFDEGLRRYGLCYAPQQLPECVRMSCLDLLGLKCSGETSAFSESWSLLVTHCLRCLLIANAANEVRNFVSETALQEARAGPCWVELEQAFSWIHAFPMQPLAQLLPALQRSLLLLLPPLRLLRAAKLPWRHWRLQMPLLPIVKSARRC